MTVKVWQDLKPLFPFLRPYRGRYVWGVLSLLAEVSFWVAVPQIIRYAIDDLQSSVTTEKLAFYAGLLVGAALCKAFFLFWTRMILIGISRDVEYDLRNHLYRHLTRLSLGYFQRTRTGDIMSRAINDLNAVRMLLGPGIMYSIRTLVLMTAAVVIMWSISPKLTIYSFALVPVIAIIVSLFGSRIHKRFEEIQEMMSNLSAKVQESMAGVRVIRNLAWAASPHYNGNPEHHPILSPSARSFDPIRHPFPVHYHLHYNLGLKRFDEETARTTIDGWPDGKPVMNPCPWPEPLLRWAGAGELPSSRFSA